MNDQLKLMAILAHPDDESMGTGGILAKYSAEGVETHLVTATRGERGWFGAEEDYPGLEALGKTREGELIDATRALGLKDVTLLDYVDGELDRADTAEVIRKIVIRIRQVRPQVVVTFDPNGVYGHPDHIAISQFTTAAVVAAADPSFDGAQEWRAHRVSKLYYMVWTQERLDAFQAVFGEIVMHVNGQQRRAPKWEDWAITTRVDTSDYWKQVWDAIARHRSQLPAYGVLKDLPEEDHKNMWGNQLYYRAFSMVNSGSQLEDDLFEGLRKPKPSHQRELVAASG